MTSSNRLPIALDGVPLFVKELTKSVLESGLLREERDRYVPRKWCSVDEEFVPDSPLEGGGFELLVPPRSLAADLTAQPTVGLRTTIPRETTWRFRTGGGAKPASS
jgi:hypothetical protein